MKRIEKVLGALVFVIIVGASQACTDDITAPGDDDPICWWVDGTLHCADGT